MAPARLSYVCGIASKPLLGETIGAYFDRAAAQWSERDALVVCHQKVKLTWRELKEKVDALAAGLLALGLEPGDRIGIWSPNNAEWTITQFAATKVGLILVNLNPAYRLAEIEYALNKVQCKAIVTAVQYKTSEYIEMLRTLAPELDSAEPGALQAKKLPHLRIAITLGDNPEPGFYRFADVVGMGGPQEHERLAEIAGQLKFDDAVNIQFTSGTTGAPKGATLTHHNLLNNGLFVGEAIALTEEDRLCIPVPLYHCFGMVMGNLACLTHGSAMVYPAEGFDPKASLEAIQAEKCTGVYGVPTMFIAQLGHADFKDYDLSSLRTGIMAGSPCPVEVMRRCIDDMNMREVSIAYGMTETSPVSFQSALDDSLERRVSTVGRIQPHLEVKIVDPDDRIVPIGTSGEICTRGYSVMIGYWDDKEKTQEVLDSNGWMHTGDLGVIDEEGYCNIVGRIKDMVIRGGENLFPAEIEEFLFRHEKVEAAQVFGVPDDRYGEELCAWIKLKSGQKANAEEIKAFCQGQIAHYKIPRYIRFVDEFPLTVTGKVQKFVMRDKMVEELGLTVAKTA